MIHWEKRRRSVCSLDILLSSEVIFALTAVTRQSRRSEAKVAEPAGCPRSLKPVVSTTGIPGDFFVGRMWCY